MGPSRPGPRSLGRGRPAAHPAESFTSRSSTGVAKCIVCGIRLVAGETEYEAGTSDEIIGPLHRDCLEARPSGPRDGHKPSPGSGDLRSHAPHVHRGRYRHRHRPPARA